MGGSPMALRRSRAARGAWHHDSMAITATRLTPALGALIEGVSLADDLPQESIDRLAGFLVEHQILFFRDQVLTPEQQCRFAARFGKLHIHPIYPVLPELPEILVLDTHGDFLPDNDNWHTDVTFTATPPIHSNPFARSAIAQIKAMGPLARFVCVTVTSIAFGQT